MKINRPQRLVGATLLGLGLAVVMLLQAMSGITYRQAPQLATTLMPMNGLARERLAFAEFGAGATDPTDMASVIQSAISAAPTAREAIADEPLLPKAHAVLALEMQDQGAQAEFLELATNLNRRDVSLQGVLLQNRVSAADYAGVFETVDRILRVNPDLSEQFFPILVQALGDEQGKEQLAGLLRDPPQWLEDFAMFAVENDAAVETLADLRRGSSMDYKYFDARLIARLVAVGDLKTAYETYSSIRDQSAQDQPEASGLWRNQYQPFDWRLANRSGFRAQISRTGNSLDVFVRPGQAGVLAERIVPVAGSGAGMKLTIKHSLDRSALPMMRVNFLCGNNTQPFRSVEFPASESVISIADRPAQCEFVRMTIYARPGSTGTPIDGAIESVSLTGA
ncbi:hypothetical protein [Parerythrobacter aestuarii]|uniref:hypothetical protein n=1 Tax=Parerythrobacter aestuarii TaxID=3020909 RepID=UPI0024DE9649|nr:hypothetical protein [Parerythrobacter aestuarii]